MFWSECLAVAWNFLSLRAKDSIRLDMLAHMLLVRGIEQEAKAIQGYIVRLFQTCKPKKNSIWFAVFVSARLAAPSIRKALGFPLQIKVSAYLVPF